MSVNISSVNSTLQPELFTYNVPALIFGVLLIIVIICGNVLVCLSVYKEKALKTTTNYFIVSLAVADLMLAVLVLPLFVYAEVSVFKRNTVFCLRHVMRGSLCNLGSQIYIINKTVHLRHIGRLYLKIPLNQCIRN